MARNITDVKNMLKAIDSIVEITVLEDNRYHIDTLLMDKNIFLEQLEYKNYTYEGGSDREFYITNENGVNYTFQISAYDIELNTEIEF